MSVVAQVDPRLGARRARVRDFNALTKPRVIVLLEVTTLFTMIAAARGLPSPLTLVATLAGGWLAAGGANAINCWFDRDIDLAMGRTRHRPIPDGRIAAEHALIFGVALGLSAFMLLATTVNLLAASLAITALLFYVLIYTMWLKRSSTQNIVIGGAAGAFPPLVGWAAVTGRVDLTAIFLFAVIFYWTPPHFWALALLLRGDYERAHVPMLPVVAGERHTRQQILLWSLLLVAITMLPFVTRGLGVIYLGGAGVLDLILLAYAVQAIRHPSARAARRLFYYSMLYLALFFAVVAVDRVLGG
ncbi:MAG: heme o synthase [Candidatus Dormibacteria bacterium]